MAEDFDQFAQRHAQEQENRERLAKETKPEWEVLKGLTSQFALDSKGLGNYRFAWVPDPSSRCALLVLNDVAVTFLDHGERDGVPQKCRVRFGRRPPGQGRTWSDEESPVAAKTWALEPMIKTTIFFGSSLSERYSYRRHNSPRKLRKSLHGITSTIRERMVVPVSSRVKFRILPSSQP
jgi:hypothetical protein